MNVNRYAGFPKKGRQSQPLRRMVTRYWWFCWTGCRTGWNYCFELLWPDELLCDELLCANPV